jgi:tRNA(Ser,Leu) C12 N-acetylase TAN1
MPPPGWNVLATSLEGRRDALLIALRRLGRFRPGGYRNVVVGTVDDRDGFLAAVRDALATDPLLPTALARLIPIEVTLRFDPTAPVDAVVSAAEPLVPRLAGGSFFVRLERRGLKGRVHSPSVERAIGDAVWRKLAEAGHVPKVEFADPDAVLVVETLGDQAGLAVVDRALRETFPFVKVR